MHTFLNFLPPEEAKVESCGPWQDKILIWLFGLIKFLWSFYQATKIFIHSSGLGDSLTSHFGQKKLK